MINQSSDELGIFVISVDRIREKCNELGIDFNDVDVEMVFHKVETGMQSAFSDAFDEALESAIEESQE